MPDVLGTAQSTMDAPPAFGTSTPTSDTDLSSLLPTKKQVESGTAALTNIQERKMGAEDVMLRQFESEQAQDRKRMEQAMAAQGATIEELKHGTWNAQEELGKRETSLWEQFGSPGFIIAMIGSRFSAMPMNSALQAGGAAMNALNQGKMEDYKRSFEAWKANTELVIKRQQMEHELYEEIEHLRSSDMAAWRVKASAIATRFDDQRKLALLQNGMDPEVIEAIEGETKAAKEMSDVKTLLTERKMQMDALNLDKDWTSGDPTRMKRAMDRMQAGKQTPEQELWDQFRRDNPDADFQRNLDAYKEIQAGKYAYRSGRAVSPSFADAPEALKGWETTRGAPATPEMRAIINDAYATKGATAGGRIAQVGEALQQIKDKLANGEKLSDADQEQILRDAVRQPVSGSRLTPESAHLVAEQYLAGDRQALAGYARSPQNLTIVRNEIAKIAKERGIEGVDLAMKIAEFHGIVSAETAVGRRMATIEMFADETLRVLDVAKRAEKDVPRGEFVPFNNALLAFEKQTGDPKVVALGAALNSLVNTYAKAINGGQQGTVSDKDHAREIIELAYSHHQMNAVFDILEKELAAAKAAPGDVKTGLQKLMRGQPEGGPAPGAPNVIKYDAEGNRVP